MYRPVGALLLLPLLAAGQISRAPSPWNAVERIVAGERIEVQLMDYTTLKGTFDHATGDVVYLGRAGKTVEARRVDVRRLWRRKSGHGGRWAIVGGLVGAAALCGGLCPYLESGPGKGYAGAVAGTAALGAIIGAGVGYGVGHGKLALVYQTRKEARQPCEEMEVGFH